MTAGMKVFLFDRSLPLTGGVAHSFLILGRYADSAQIELHALFCQRTSTDSDAEFLRAGITPHSIGDQGYLRPARALRRLLRQHHPAIVLCCSLKPYLLARMAAAGRPTRIVFWHVAITDILDGPLRTTLYRTLARNTDLLANSQATANAGRFPAHRGRTRIVHLGVPDVPPPPRTGRTSRLGIPDDSRIIAYTASFVAYKQHKILLEAFARLAPDFPNLHLLLIGVGPLQAAMQAHAATLPAERIHFVGARADVRELLGAIDIYAHPAVGEGFGLAVVEAMLASLPIVAANAGALPELIDDASTGFLCAPNDSADLAAHLRRLLDNPDLRRTLGEAARQAALRRFAPETYAACFTAAVAEFAISP